MSDRDAERSQGVGRRRFLAAGGAATAVGLSGCTSSLGLGGGAGDTLRVSTWSGTNETVFREVIKPRYEEQTGNSLEVTGNWQGILSKIRQSPADDPPFDVTVGVGRTTYRGQQEGLWEPVDYDGLSNAGAIKPRLREFPMAEAGVPVAYGAHAYVYNEDSADWTPESWSDVRSPEATNLALPSDFWLKLFMMAALLRDDEPLAGEVYDRQYLDELFEVVESLPVSTFYQGTQQLWTALGEGLADVGHYFFAYGLRKARTTDEYSIGVTVPEPTTGYIDYYQVVRGTSNRTMAEEFVDFLLQADTQSAYAEAFNLGFSNEETTYPEATSERLPTTNDELQRVAFQNFARVAEFSGEMNDRFRSFVQNN
jgi:spermidine/putrescine transport system substrate-binding protein